MVVFKSESCFKKYEKKEKSDIYLGYITFVKDDLTCILATEASCNMDSQGSSWIRSASS